MPQRKQLTPEERQKLINLLKGAAPPDPDSISEEERLKMFRKLLEPERKDIKLDLKGFDEKGNRMYADIQLPPSPYPFKNPVTMTKELDESVRDIRGLAPGAGTARPNTLTNVPPTGYIASRAGDLESGLGLAPAVLRGEFDPRETTLLGMSPVKENDKQYGNNVYINPNIKKHGYDPTGVVAHELSHRNYPSTEDDENRGFYWKPSAQYVEDLYKSLKKKK